MTALPPPDAEVRPSAPQLGGHLLSERLAGSGEPPALPHRDRRKRTGLVLGLLGGAAVVGALIVTQVAANVGFDTAAENYADAAAVATRSMEELRTETSEMQAVADSAALLPGEAAEVIVVDPAFTENLAAAIAEADDVAGAAGDLLGADVPAVDDKPLAFWELFGSTARLEEQARDVNELSADLNDGSREVSDAADAITDSGVGLVNATGEAAAAFEAAHISARNDAVVALRSSAAEAISTVTIDETTPITYTALQNAAALVVSTEAEELGEKAGPLMDKRLEIEAFARALAPGVLLEFDWAPIVNGAGDNGSMGGYTTWWWDDPGRSVIQLSNSVAEQWPADRSQALIAHEVGHAISVKCEDAYDSSTQDSIEKWATAWAISMGFIDEANGVWAYGYPPQEYIDAAAGCR